MTTPHRFALEEALIAARLDEIVCRTPALSELRALLSADLRMTVEWVVAYHSSAVPPERRSLLLRALLGDPTSGIDPRAARITRPVLERAVAWWDANGALEGRDRAREFVPRGFAAMMGEPRGFDALIQRIGVKPWWALMTGGEVSHPAYAGLVPEDLAPLQMLFERRRLSGEQALELADPEGVRSTPRCEWFFDTGCAPLDLRNAVVFLAALLARRDGGRAQNRLPIALTNRWGLPRLSIPHAMIFCDIVVMMATGAIERSQVAQDPFGFREVLAPGPGLQFVCAGDADAQAAMAAHLRLGVVDPALACRRQALMQEGLREGVFDTGLLFNLPRLLGMPGFAVFAPYYDAVAPGPMLAIAGPRWAAAGPHLPGQMARLHAARRIQASRLRDIGNVLAYLAALGIDPRSRTDAWHALPSVARFGLGAAEPVPGGRRAGAGGMARRRASGTHARALPDLERLVEAEPTRRAYVLAPGYLGRLPDTGRVVIHAAHALAYQLPAAVEVVGEAPIPWGADPAQLAAQWLVDQGFTVEVLIERRV